MQVHTIDLNNFRSPAAETFTGRDRGKAVRHRARLDDLDAKPNSRARVLVPDDVYTLASSFFLGMFGPSVVRFGKEEFLARYEFVGQNVPVFLEEGVKEALKERQRLNSRTPAGGLL